MLCFLKCPCTQSIHRLIGLPQGLFFFFFSFHYISSDMMWLTSSDMSELSQSRFLHLLSQSLYFHFWSSIFSSSIYLFLLLSCLVVPAITCSRVISATSNLFTLSSLIGQISVPYNFADPAIVRYTWLLNLVDIFLSYITPDTLCQAFPPCILARLSTIF